MQSTALEMLVMPVTYSTVAALLVGGVASTIARWAGWAVAAMVGNRRPPVTREELEPGYRVGIDL